MRRRPDPDAPPPHARTLALRLLNRRDYAAEELRRALVERGCEPAAVDPVVASLVEDRSVDDRRLAGAYVRTATRVKGRGRRRIARELEARGIAGEIVEAALRELEPEDEAAALERVLARKRIPDRLSAPEHRRLFHQLLRRGFPAEVIAKALRAHRR